MGGAGDCATMCALQQCVIALQQCVITNRAVCDLDRGSDFSPPRSPCMFRTVVIAAALATLPVLSPCTLVGQQGASPSSGGAQKPMTLPKPVNLKVLPKDTSPEDVMKIMKGFSQQLGVGCPFCHAQEAGARFPNFASDQKPEK